MTVPTVPGENPTASEDHFIRALDIRTKRVDDTSAVASVQVGIEGLVEAGLVALMVDVVGGQVSLAAGRPCGISTTDINIHGIGSLLGPGLLRADAELVSISRQRTCVRVAVGLGDDRRRALASATFRLWPEPLDLDLGDPAGRTTGEAARRLDTTLWEYTGITVHGAAAVAEVALGPRIANHIGSLQGGVTATLLERAARQVMEPGEVLDAMTVTYLSQGRVGPVRAVAAPRPPGAPIVVEAHDMGNADRSVAHAIASTGPLRSQAASRRSDPR